MFRTSQHTAYAFDDFITSEHILLHLQNDKKITNWYAERYLTMTGQCRPTQSFKNINLLVQSINAKWKTDFLRAVFFFKESKVTSCLLH